MSGEERRGARIVGVLGGMGPEATVDLMARIVAATPARDDSDHAHLLVDCNPKVPSRLKALLEGDGESPGPTLGAMAARLVAMGAHALAMPCNTAHAYLPRIREQAGEAHVFDMVALAAERLAAAGHARIGMLASTAVRNVGLYEDALRSRGLEPLWPARQDDAVAAIRAVKAGDAARGRALLGPLGVALMADGADALLIACTEFSVIRDALPKNAAQLDAMDALAEAVAAYAQGGA